MRECACVCVLCMHSKSIVSIVLWIVHGVGTKENKVIINPASQKYTQREFVLLVNLFVSEKIWWYLLFACVRVWCFLLLLCWLTKYQIMMIQWFNYIWTHNIYITNAYKNETWMGKKSINVAEKKNSNVCLMKTNWNIISIITTITKNENLSNLHVFKIKSTKRIIYWL